MTIEERLANLVWQLGRAKRRNRWLLASRQQTQTEINIVSAEIPPTQDQKGFGV